MHSGYKHRVRVLYNKREDLLGCIVICKNTVYMKVRPQGLVEITASHHVLQYSIHNIEQSDGEIEHEALNRNLKSLGSKITNKHM